MVTIVALAILVFLNPIWVSFEQDRTGAAALTGFDAVTVHAVTNSILHDLVFGPPDFAVAVGQVLILGNLAIYARGRAWFRRAVRRGAIILAILVVLLGGLAAIAFDALFETFHELFFPAGSFDFAASSKLIQLFPDQFWFETSLLLAAVILGLSALFAVLASGGRDEPGSNPA